MNKAAEFYKGLNEAIGNKINSIAPFRAMASAINDGRVQIQQIGADAPMSEQFAKLAGASVEVGDEVAVLMLGGKPFVLGKIVRTAADDTPSFDGTFTSPVIIQSTDADAFRVMNGSGLEYFAIDTDSSPEIEIMNGAVLVGFSDTYSASTDTFRIFSATGNAQFDGSLTYGGALYGSADNVFLKSEVQQTPATASTTTVGTYVTQNDALYVLPTGTWEINAFAFQRLAHSAGGSVSARIRIGTTNGTDITGSASSATTPFGPTCIATGQSGNVWVYVEAKNNATGTMYLGASSLFSICRRTG